MCFKIMRRVPVSRRKVPKLPHQEIRLNFGILRNVVWTINLVSLTLLSLFPYLRSMCHQSRVYRINWRGVFMALSGIYDGTIALYYFRKESPS